MTQAATTLPTDVTLDPLNPADSLNPEGEAAAKDKEVNQAMQIAWAIYLVLALAPAPLAIVGIWRGLLVSTSDADLSNQFMMLNFLFLGLAVPASFWFQRKCFANYYKGECVAPRDYLKGMVAIWLPLATAGVAGMLGWIISGTPLMSIVPTILALVVYLVFHPSGAAMYRPVGDHDDPAVYEEPA